MKRCYHGNFSIGLQFDSTLTAEYTDLIDSIERISKFVDIFIVKSNMIIIVIPPMFLSIFNYYINDLGDESFPNMPIM